MCEIAGASIRAATAEPRITQFGLPHANRKALISDLTFSDRKIDIPSYVKGRMLNT